MIFKVFRIAGFTRNILCASGIFDDAWLSVHIKCDHGLEIKIATLNGRDTFFELISGDWGSLSLLGDEVTKVFWEDGDNIVSIDFVGEKGL